MLATAEGDILISDDQIIADLKYCLYSVFNNIDVQQYSKQFIRLLKRLREHSQSLNANILFALFDECIKELLRGIRNKIVEDIKAQGLIQSKKVMQMQRRYSYDDYFLIERALPKPPSVLMPDI
jgi:hypothetical protein